MLDLLVPGRVVGRDLVKKTLCFFRCYQNAMPREFQKELCRKPIWSHLKRERQKEEKDLNRWGRRAQGLWKGAMAAVTAWVLWTAHLVKCTYQIENAEAWQGRLPSCTASLPVLACLFG